MDSMVDNIQSMVDRCTELLKVQADPDVQTELYRLHDILERVGEENNGPFLSRAESALAIVDSQEPNVRLLKEIRNQLDLMEHNRKKGIVPWLRKKLGHSPLQAMLTGVSCSFGFWIVFMIVSIPLAEILRNNNIIETAFSSHDMTTVCLGAVIGACISLVSRSNDFSNLYIYDPFLIFTNSFFKPLVACIFAITVYAIFVSGLIKITGLEELANTGQTTRLHSSVRFTPSGPTTSTIAYLAILWVLGFVSGFSERLATDIVARAEGLITPGSGATNRG